MATQKLAIFGHARHFLVAHSSNHAILNYQIMAGACRRLSTRAEAQAFRLMMVDIPSALDSCKLQPYRPSGSPKSTRCRFRSPSQSDPVGLELM